ncbi:MAG: hypothetical protein AAFX02_04430 [Pseudomonadota bacterium]
MLAFRVLLIVLLVAVVAYTIPVVMNHGVNLLPVFFGDIAKLAWPGQFNMDFMGFLILSGVWTMWRNQFSPAGIGLGVLAIFFGIPFLTTYLLILSFRTNGDVRTIMLGQERARA